MTRCEQGNATSFNLVLRRKNPEQRDNEVNAQEGKHVVVWLASACGRRHYRRRTHEAGSRKRRAVISGISLGPCISSWIGGAGSSAVVACGRMSVIGNLLGRECCRLNASKLPYLIS